MFLDSDDIYAKDIIAIAYERAVKTNSDLVLYNFARFVGKPSRLAVKNKLNPRRDIVTFTKGTYSNRFFNDFAIITWNKLVKRSVITDNSLLFDVTLSHNHDVDFSIRLMIAASSYSWLDEIGYYYRSNEVGLTATKRSDPTNVLKILLNLNELIISKDKELKRSFDNYVADMVVGTLVKYKNSPVKQKEIFIFAHEVLIPRVGLDEKDDGYLFTQSAKTFALVKAGKYDQYAADSDTLKQRLRAMFRNLNDVVQTILSRFIV